MGERKGAARGAWIGAALASAGVVSAAWAADAARRAQGGRHLHRTLVELLLNALTVDEPATARHSRRVADLAFALARARGMGRRARATLRVAALLHDLGKIDDRFFHILHSRRRLSARERAEIEFHPEQSARILEPLESLHPGIQRIVASHHERWDGSGYPAGTAGEKIPLASRIISLADAFDAVTQPRGYSEPVPAAKALGMLRRGAGKQFDPELVRLLDAPALREEWGGIARKGLADERRHLADPSPTEAPLERQPAQ
ncbi:MAG TPA: HD domain-containing phosphohydrolase [Longimicrobiaceae bacterium]|nr:HD domain-containing phosphohydrolase [Longimicrobiaceae bacterium]